MKRGISSQAPRPLPVSFPNGADLRLAVRRGRPEVEGGGGVTGARGAAGVGRGSWARGRGWPRCHADAARTPGAPGGAASSAPAGTGIQLAAFAAAALAGLSQVHAGRLGARGVGAAGGAGEASLLPVVLWHGEGTL